PVEPSSARAGSPRISVEIASVPLGAEVSSGHTSLGITPIRLKLPKSRVPLELSIQKTGYVPLTQTVTPDVDSRIQVVLRRVRSAARAHHKVREEASPAVTVAREFRRFN